jgi:hypothetical protein
MRKNKIDEYNIIIFSWPDTHTHTHEHLNRNQGSSSSFIPDKRKWLGVNQKMIGMPRTRPRDLPLNISLLDIFFRPKQTNTFIHYLSGQQTNKQTDRQKCA